MGKPIEARLNINPNYQVADWQFLEFYSPGIPELSFGYHFRGPETHGFTWDGSIDFSTLDKDILINLASQILGAPIDLDLEPVEASLIITNASMEKLHLNLSDQRERFRQRLETPSLVSFVRLDVGMDKESRKFSFTADNPTYLKPSEKAEIAIALPSQTSWSEGIIEWIKAHHVQPSTAEIDPKEAVVVFSASSIRS